MQNSEFLNDIHAESDKRGILLDEVGISDFKLPIKVSVDDTSLFQNTVANIEVSVDLPADKRGIHMSRIVKEINKLSENTLNVPLLLNISKSLLKLQNSFESTIFIEFPIFLEKISPISNIKSKMNYLCYYKLISSKKREILKNTRTAIFKSVKVPVTLLCPCSKAISKNNAHNQRCEVLISVISYPELSFLELIQMAESSASAPIYSFLKREDEKFVTEFSYENPKFVEDLVRNIALKLNCNETVRWYKISAKSFESIHSHNVIARLTRNKTLK